MLTLLATAIAAGSPALHAGTHVLVRLDPSDRALWHSTGSVTDIVLLVEYLWFVGRILPGEA